MATDGLPHCMQVRSLVLWIATLPFVLAGAMSPISIALWVSLIVYIFVGIEEVGVQVGGAAVRDLARHASAHHGAPLPHRWSSRSRSCR